MAKKNTITNSLKDFRRLRRRYERIAPTPAWADEMLRGKHLPSGMLKCKRCKHIYPPYYVRSGICYDCYLEGIPAHIIAQFPSAISIFR
jgi:hypothetical protein